MQCPRCTQGDLDLTLTGMVCPVCGYDLYADDDHIPGNEPDWDPAAFQQQQAAAQAAPPVPPIKLLPGMQPRHAVIDIDLPPTVYRERIPGLSDRERMRFESRCLDAVAALADGDEDRARQLLHAALDITDMSSNVWLFLAGIAQSRDEQRDALEQSVGCNPSNLIAVEALARLRGDLDQAAVARAKLEPGETDQRQVKCPTCGGLLAFDSGAQQVTCHHCGHLILNVAELARSSGPDALMIGLLKRKQDPRAWNIGQRWARCDACGATTTLSRHTLSNTCRFCGSQNILAESTTHRFEQPDFIVPFEVDHAAALAAVDQHLTSGLRRISRLFADDVARIELSGVYLPFWVFDAEMSVNWSWTNAPHHGQHPVLLGDVLWFAAAQPDRKLLQHLEPFDLARGKSYDPRLLATYPAELYGVDVDRASLDVRARLTTQAERKAHPSLMAHKPLRGHGQWGSDDGPGRLVMNATTQFMSYRFGLLPVWVGRLVEDDGDVQPVAVNGQTGKVALGRQA